jgi:sulfate adenylyltransferase subunit 1 (EFTu-like GTPase family)
MTARPDPREFAIEDFLQRQERKSLLRFIACGSVDHGKSTLIGRLLYEAKLLFDDQIETLAPESRKHGTRAEDHDRRGVSVLRDRAAQVHRRRRTRP